MGMQWEGKSFIENLPKIYGVYTGGFLAFFFLMAFFEQMGMGADTIGIGADVDLGGKTKLTFHGARSSVAFDRDETFLGIDLANALNRTSNTEQLQVRYKLTPLTTFVTTVQAAQDRFELDRLRDQLARGPARIPELEAGRPLLLPAGKRRLGVLEGERAEPGQGDLQVGDRRQAAEQQHGHDQQDDDREQDQGLARGAAPASS